LAKPSSFAALELLDVSSCNMKRHSMLVVLQSGMAWHVFACEIVLTLQDPPPRFSFHQRVFRMCSLPSSWSLSTAPLIAVRYGESATERLCTAWWNMDASGEGGWDAETSHFWGVTYYNLQQCNTINTQLLIISFPRLHNLAFESSSELPCTAVFCILATVLIFV
jgi:hypothetical protein